MNWLSQILGGGVGQLFKDIVGSFKLSPDKEAELLALAEQNKQALLMKQAELEAKAQDVLAEEVKSSADIIKQEASSQSWLPRNVRPFLLLCWGLAITVNAVIPIVARLRGVDIQPIPLDPWVYKLTAIGYTGYVAFRSVDKWIGMPGDSQVALGPLKIGNKN